MTLTLPTLLFLTALNAAPLAGPAEVTVPPPAVAPAPASAPGTAPGPGPAVAAVVVTPNPAEPWLERIEEKASALSTLQARLVWKRVEPLRGDEQTRFGRLVYAARKPARFAVHFERTWIDVDGKKQPVVQNRWYIYDGVWLVEKLEDKKQFIKRQVGPLPNQADPASRAEDPLLSGNGPFVLPLSLRKAEVLARFNVKLLDSAEPEDDEESDELAKRLKDALRLRFTVRPPRQMEFTAVDLWYDRATLLPLRVVTLDKRGNESTLGLHKHEINAPIDESLMDTTEPKAGWNVTVTPWEGRSPATEP